jgi:hypothetical protein
MISIDLDRALQYIDEHGNLQDKARLLYILASEPPPDSIVRPLLDKQNPDGGFPSRPRTENPSSVDNTLTALWQLNELGLFHSAEARRACKFLVAAQAEDGSWDENPALPKHDLPPWIKPGQLATRNYLSAYAAFWLGIFDPRLPALGKAIRYLAGQQAADGQVPGYQHGQWIATSAFFFAGEGYQEHSRKGLAFLDMRPPEQWEASQIAWALDCLAAAGVPAQQPFVAKMLAELAGRQEPGGSWSSEDGPAYAVSATISAIKAFKRYGAVDLQFL